MKLLIREGADKYIINMKHVNMVHIAA